MCSIINVVVQDCRVDPMSYSRFYYELQDVWSALRSIRSAFIFVRMDLGADPMVLEPIEPKKGLTPIEPTTFSWCNGACCLTIVSNEGAVCMHSCGLLDGVHFFWPKDGVHLVLSIDRGTDTSYYKEDSASYCVPLITIIGSAWLLMWSQIRNYVASQKLEWKYRAYF